MRKTGATLDELKEFVQTCVLDFTDEEKAALTKAVASIESKLNAMGAALPFPEDIAFVKTTMQEEFQLRHCARVVPLPYTQLSRVPQPDVQPHRFHHNGFRLRFFP